MSNPAGDNHRTPEQAAREARYAEHLGVDPVPTSYDAEPWTQEGGCRPDRVPERGLRQPEDPDDNPIQLWEPRSPS